MKIAAAEIPSPGPQPTATPAAEPASGIVLILLYLSIKTFILILTFKQKAYF